MKTIFLTRFMVIGTLLAPPAPIIETGLEELESLEIIRARERTQRQKARDPQVGLYVS